MDDMKKRLLEKMMKATYLCDKEGKLFMDACFKEERLCHMLQWVATYLKAVKVPDQVQDYHLTPEEYYSVYQVSLKRTARTMTKAIEDLIASLPEVNEKDDRHDAIVDEVATDIEDLNHTASHRTHRIIEKLSSVNIEDLETVKHHARKALKWQRHIETDQEWLPFDITHDQARDEYDYHVQAIEKHLKL